MRAKKIFGQHFLFDQGLLARIVDAAHITKDDAVVEIGPGPGIMTELLAKRAKSVLAIEIDSDLYEHLKMKLVGYSNLKLIHMDILKYSFEMNEQFKVVANIPYYITTPIIFHLIQSRAQISSMVLTIQKEVAERIVAAPGCKDYGVLSLAVQYYADASIQFTIPREAFRPAPKVDSAVIRMTMLEKPPVAVRDEKTLFRVIKAAFSMRRKTLANALRSLVPDSRKLLIRAEIDPSRRAETLSVREFAKIADLLS
jgi:16S rRNA (adenine1518-N6/adenine1519-N6)-dimethyltransferase